MSITGILNKGRPDAGIIEKASDFILAFPRKMWLNRIVDLNNPKDTTQNNFTKTTAKTMNAVKDIYPIGPLMVGAIGLFYAGASIAAAPFLLLGAALKKLAAKIDKTTGLYQTVVENKLKQEKLHSNIESLKKAKEATDAKIKKAQPVAEAVKQQPALKKYMFINPSKLIVCLTKRSEKITKVLEKLESKVTQVTANYVESLKQYEQSKTK